MKGQQIGDLIYVDRQVWEIKDKKGVEDDEWENDEMMK
jgi:hypothetical protein